MPKPDPAERLEQANAEARELLRDLNSAGKDLRRTLKEARTLIASDVASRLETEVAAQVAKLAEVNEEKMRASVEKIVDEFNKLGAILLGVDRAEPLEVMVRRVAAKPGGRNVDPYETAVDYDLDVLDAHPVSTPRGADYA